MTPRATPRRRRRRPRGQGGFTLLELLVTTAIAVIGFAGLLGMNLATTNGNSASSRAAEAVAACQTTVEHLRSETVTGMALELTGTGTAPLPITNVTMTTVIGRNGMTYGRKATIEELDAASPDLIRIHVDVTWSDDGAVPGSDGGIHDHVVSLETIRTRQEGL